MGKIENISNDQFKDLIVYRDSRKGDRLFVWLRYATNQILKSYSIKCSDEREDLRGAMLVKFFEEIKNIYGANNPKAYAYVLMNNKVRDSMRKEVNYKKYHNKFFTLVSNTEAYKNEVAGTLASEYKTVYK